MRDKRKAKADLHRYLEALHNHIARSKQAGPGENTEEAGESEQIFRVIFDNAADGILLADVESKKFYMGNKVICQMLGCNEDELKNLGVMDIHPEEHLSYVIEQFEKQMKGELTLAKDMPVIRKDGSVFYADINAFPITFGEKTYLMGIFRDITERREMEETLRQSEERYRSVVDDSPGLICSFLPDGEITFVNTAYCEYFGKTSEELIGSKFTSLIPEEDRQAVLDDILSLTVDSPLMTHEHKVTASDGWIRWQRWTNRAIFNEQDSAVLFQSFGEDITERRQAEEQIRKLSSAVEQSIDGIAINTLEPKILYANKAYARMHGYAPEEMVGMEVAALQSRDSVDKFERAKYLIRAHGSWSGESMHVRKDGADFPVYLSVTLLKDDKGEPTGIIAICRDITEYKKIQEQLSAYREKMARTEQLASLGTLSATLAHELTQPLTIIRLSLESAVEKLGTIPYPENFANKLKDSLYQVSSMGAITERFRNFARRSSDYVIGEVDLKAVVERIVAFLSESARRVKVELRLEDWDEIPPMYWNENDLEQLFFALVNNTIQATDGKKDRWLIIKGLMKDKNVVLQFSDNCGGISPDVLDRIFEPFFTTKPPGQGTGLGLCIVRDIITRAGGGIRVESKFGEGSTFFVTLPISEDRISQLGSGK